jgi:hypothetical protein
MFTFVWVYEEYSITYLHYYHKMTGSLKKVWQAHMEQCIATKETYFEGNIKYI